MKKKMKLFFWVICFVFPAPDKICLVKFTLGRSIDKIRNTKRSGKVGKLKIHFDFILINRSIYGSLANL